MNFLILSKEAPPLSCPGHRRAAKVGHQRDASLSLVHVPLPRTLFVTLAISAALIALPAPAPGGVASGGKPAVRKQLQRELKRDPKAVLKPAFIRKAAAVDFS